MHEHTANASQVTIISIKYLDEGGNVWKNVKYMQNDDVPFHCLSLFIHIILAPSPLCSFIRLVLPKHSHTNAEIENEISVKKKWRKKKEIKRKREKERTRYPQISNRQTVSPVIRLNCNWIHYNLGSGVHIHAQSVRFVSHANALMHRYRYSWVVSVSV